MSLNLTYLLNMIILDFWISSSAEFKDTWVSIDERTYQEWPVYMRIGFYGAILECLGWWNLNICFLFSGYLGTASIAAQVVIMQIKNFTTMIPKGIAFAASGLVGNCIGMNQVNRARNYAEVNIIFSMVVTFLLLWGFIVYAEPLSYIFTSDDDIALTTRQCFWSLFLYIFFSTVKGV